MVQWQIAGRWLVVAAARCARAQLTAIAQVLMLVSTLGSATLAIANDQPPSGSYLINAGDVLSLQVWNEPTLGAAQILVRPDGFISVPVLGELKASGETVGELTESIVAGLSRYLKDEPTVVISVSAASGSQIFVLGKVARSGAFAMRGPMDVTQALALAGGLNSFAAGNKIKVLRRDDNGVQRSMKFKYSAVKDGDDLTSNILLKSGDVVLVP